MKTITEQLNEIRFKTVRIDSVSGGNYMLPTEVIEQIKSIVSERDEYVRGVWEVMPLDMDNVEKEIGYSEALEFVRKRQEKTL